MVPTPERRANAVGRWRCLRRCLMLPRSEQRPGGKPVNCRRGPAPSPGVVSGGKATQVRDGACHRHEVKSQRRMAELQKVLGEFRML